MRTTSQASGRLKDYSRSAICKRDLGPSAIGLSYWCLNSNLAGNQISTVETGAFETLPSLWSL